MGSVFGNSLMEFYNNFYYHSCLNLKLIFVFIFQNKVVLVVRSGIGLLPLLCVRVGLAKKVIALEESDCIEYARRIVKDNSYSHMITFIQSSVILYFSYYFYIFTS